MSDIAATGINPSPPLSGLKVLVVDYESGNLRSVARALEKAGVSPQISGDPDALESADAAVLPGVGSGDAAMAELQQRGLVEPLRRFAASGRPFLGVCLGLQLLMERTEEGDAECLGILPGRVRRLPQGLKVPHMGWNLVRTSTDHPVLRGLPREAYFYFVHSFYAEPSDPQLTVGVTEYGVRFSSICAKDNLIATQFHPEKSGPLGLQLYRNFVEHAALVAAGTR